VPGGRLEAIDEESRSRFAREAARGLVALDGEDLAHPRLTLPLIVSVWMRRSGAGTVTARRALLDVRAALLEESGTACCGALRTRWRRRATTWRSGR